MYFTLTLRGGHCWQPPVELRLWHCSWPVSAWCRHTSWSPQPANQGNSGQHLVKHFPFKRVWRNFNFSRCSWCKHEGLRDLHRWRSECFEAALSKLTYTAADFTLKRTRVKSSDCASEDYEVTETPRSESDRKQIKLWFKVWVYL